MRGTIKERIERIGKIVGVNYTDKTYENFKQFLEMYAEMKSDVRLFDIDMDEVKLQKVAPMLFEAMMISEPIPRDMIEELVMIVVQSGKTPRLIQESLENVRKFSPDGEQYHQILWQLYFDDTIHSNIEVELSLNCSHRTYHNKKRYAVMLFGIACWGEIMSYWKDARREMQKIEAALEGA